MSQSLAEENKELKRELQFLKDQLTEVTLQQPKQEQVPKSSASEPSGARVLSFVSEMPVYKTADGGCWHVEENCLAKRARTKVVKVKPCAVCVPRLKAYFGN